MDQYECSVAYPPEFRHFRMPTVVFADSMAGARNEYLMCLGRYQPPPESRYVTDVPDSLTEAVLKIKGPQGVQRFNVFC